MSTSNREKCGAFQEIRRRRRRRRGVAKENHELTQSSSNVNKLCYILLPCCNYNYLLRARQSLEIKLSRLSSHYPCPLSIDALALTLALAYYASLNRLLVVDFVRRLYPIDAHAMQQGLLLLMPCVGSRCDSTSGLFHPFPYFIVSLNT
jgi:hypothetical protein